MPSETRRSLRSPLGGQAQFLATSGLYSKWAAACPVRYSSPHANNDKGTNTNRVVVLWGGDERVSRAEKTTAAAGQGPFLFRIPSRVECFSRFALVSLHPPGRAICCLRLPTYLSQPFEVRAANRLELVIRLPHHE